MIESFFFSLLRLKRTEKEREKNMILMTRKRFNQTSFCCDEIPHKFIFYSIGFCDSITQWSGIDHFVSVCGAVSFFLRNISAGGMLIIILLGISYLRCSCILGWFIERIFFLFQSERFVYLFIFHNSWFALLSRKPFPTLFLPFSKSKTKWNILFLLCVK